MVESGKKRSKKSRRKPEQEAETTGEGLDVRVIPPPIPESLRSELSEATSDLIFSAQQVVAMAVQVKCDKRDECVLVEACRELSKRVAQFIEVQRKIARSR